MDNMSVVATRRRSNKARAKESRDEEDSDSEFEFDLVRHVSNNTLCVLTNVVCNCGLRACPAEGIHGHTYRFREAGHLSHPPIILLLQQVHVAYKRYGTLAPE